MTQFMNTLHKVPVLLDCNFIVDSTNGNGLGIRSLKGPGIAAVYMNTSATPAAGNPNPAAGAIVVQLQDNYNRSFSGFNSIVSPLSGTALKIDNSALTAGNPYVITTVDPTDTAAQWAALGLPAGNFPPQVGMSFIALTAGAGSNTSLSRVMLTASAGSGISSIETVGDPNQTIAPLNSPGIGSQFILQCFQDGVITAPTNGTVISLAFYLSNSSVQVQGE